MFLYIFIYAFVSLYTGLEVVGGEEVVTDRTRSCDQVIMNIHEFNS